MYVMTENRKQIIKAKAFYVTRTIGDKQGKYAIVVGGLGNGLETPFLAHFADEESAMAELKRVWEALKTGERFYQSEKTL